MHNSEAERYARLIHKTGAYRVETAGVPVLNGNAGVAPDAAAPGFTSTSNAEYAQSLALQYRARQMGGSGRIFKVTWRREDAPVTYPTAN